MIDRREFFKLAAAIGLSSPFHFLKGDDKKKIKAFKDIFKKTAPKKLWKYHKEVYHYLDMGENVQCGTCPNRCILEPDDRGICRVKVNKNGKLYNIAYGNPSAINVDPIEKKPLYHFYPGTSAFSIATGGCMLRCLNCQNWSLSQKSPEDLQTMDMFPNKVVRFAKKYKCKSIAYTYSEPTAWYEYMYDISRIAKTKKIKNVWVSSGYIEETPLKKLCELIDGANIDLKSFSNETYKNLNAGELKPILRTLKILDKYKIWFEITCLMVPTYSDDLSSVRDMCKWILDNIGPGYPVHFTRFFPKHKLQHLPPTPIRTLNKAYDIAIQEGLNYVFVGNVPPTNKRSDTICPKCKKILISRRGYAILENNIKNGKCKYCHTTIQGRWNDV